MIKIVPSPSITQALYHTMRPAILSAFVWGCNPRSFGADANSVISADACVRIISLSQDVAYCKQTAQIVHMVEPCVSKGSQIRDVKKLAYRRENCVANTSNVEETAKAAAVDRIALGFSWW